MGYLSDMSESGGAAAFQNEPDRDVDEVPTAQLVAGTSFVVCSPSGEIRPGGHGGYFAGDTRLLSTLGVLVRASGSDPWRTTPDDRRCEPSARSGPRCVPTSW